MSFNGFVGRAIVTRNLNNLRDRYTCTLALVDDTGAVWSPSGSEVKLTGYTAVAAGNVAASDTVIAAIAKLEARIAALEAA